jgi:RNA polymerase sigma factor (sigma-70 family)
MPPTRDSAGAPHLDPTEWGRLIDSIDAASVFVLIGGWLGPRARGVSVEDVWQETLWLAWRDRQQHEWVNLRKYRAWLLGIARNRAHTVLRGERRLRRGGQFHHERFSALGGNETVGHYLPPQSTTPSRIATNLERARLLEQALEAVDETLRELVRLRLFEERSTQEAANLLGIPLSTAKDRLVRGTQSYRAALTRLLGVDSAIGNAEQRP